MKLADFLKIDQDPRERVQVFIDGSNLYHSLKGECSKTSLDYYGFANMLVNKRKLIRTTFYIGTVTHNADMAKNQQKFLNALRQTPYITVKTRPLKSHGSGAREKGVDILLATDMLIGAMSNGYDTTILVSGDGDFAPVLDEIKRTGKQIENAAFSSSRSDALINASDLFIELDCGTLKSCFRS